MKKPLYEYKDQYYIIVGKTTSMVKILNVVDFTSTVAHEASLGEPIDFVELIGRRASGQPLAPVHTLCEDCSNYAQFNDKIPMEDLAFKYLNAHPTMEFSHMETCPEFFRCNACMTEHYGLKGIFNK